MMDTKEAVYEDEWQSSSRFGHAVTSRPMVEKETFMGSLKKGFEGAQPPLIMRGCANRGGGGGGTHLTSW